MLTKAQRIAEQWPGRKEGVTVKFYVVRESQYGPDARLYRIYRDPEGVVHTKILSDED